MQESHPFTVWACRAGFVTIKSGPMVLQVPAAQAEELGQAIHRAALSLLPAPPAPTPLPLRVVASAVD